MKRMGRKSFLASLALGLLLLGNAVTAQAIVLTFDDIPGQTLNGYGPIGSNYHGFDFGATNYLNRMDWIDTGSSVSGWPFGARSGYFTMLNNYYGDAVITQTGGGTFTFTGMWIEGWSNLSQAGYVEGFLGGFSQYQTSFTAGSTFGYVTGSAAPIDKLVIHTTSNFLVDDLALNGGAPVPVPATLLLLAPGLAGLAAVRRRFKR